MGFPEDMEPDVFSTVYRERRGRNRLVPTWEIPLDMKTSGRSDAALGQEQESGTSPSSETGQSSAQVIPINTA